MRGRMVLRRAEDVVVNCAVQQVVAADKLVGRAVALPLALAAEQRYVSQAS